MRAPRVVTLNSTVSGPFYTLYDEKNRLTIDFPLLLIASVVKGLSYFCCRSERGNPRDNTTKSKSIVPSNEWQRFVSESGIHISVTSDRLRHFGGDRGTSTEPRPKKGRNWSRRCRTITHRRAGNLPRDQVLFWAISCWSSSQPGPATARYPAVFSPHHHRHGCLPRSSFILQYLSSFS